MTATEQPLAYLESFGCHFEGDDGCEHPGDCRWGYACNICGRNVDSEPCPDHAPLNVPGLMRVACEADPPHVAFVLAHNGYEGPCFQCEYGRLAETHRRCEHSRHGRWRSWRLTGRIGFWLANLGVGQFGSVSWGGGCNHCHTRWRWGSGYALWRPTDWWGCLLRRRHVRTETWCYGFPIGICAKCNPCPGCEGCQPGAGVAS